MRMEQGDGTTSHMNSVSRNRVKRRESRRRHNVSILLIAMMVLSSWLGCQLLLVSACFIREEVPESVLGFAAAGVLMLFFSLFLLLRFKRLDTTPYKESALLFFGIFIVALPVLTCLDWMYLNSSLSNLDSTKTVTGVGQAIKYASAFASLVYFVVGTVWARTVVPNYHPAKPGSISANTMSRLSALFVAPYTDN